MKKRKRKAELIIDQVKTMTSSSNSINRLYTFKPFFKEKKAQFYHLKRYIITKVFCLCLIYLNLKKQQLCVGMVTKLKNHN